MDYMKLMSTEPGVGMVKKQKQNKKEEQEEYQHNETQAHRPINVGGWSKLVQMTCAAGLLTLRFLLIKLSQFGCKCSNPSGFKSYKTEYSDKCKLGELNS